MNELADTIDLAAPPAQAIPLSLTGCEWVFKVADDRLTTAIMQQHDLPEVLARILAARGAKIEDVENFLNPSLKHLLPDPYHLKDMDIAAARVAKAITNKETIAIFGDYDVDGATSSALLMQYFRALGNNPIVYIPDRMSEGYGPNAKAMLTLKERGASVVITVDCGTLAFDALDAAHAAGLDVIVVDHHQGEARLPKAIAVVNPNRLDETSEHRHLAAVGVAFLLAVAVNKTLRDQEFFIPSPHRGEVRRGASQTRDYPIPDIKEFARDLRKNMTDAETSLWQFLRRGQFNIKFRKQHPIGAYITDFACLDPKLIIELDGGQHGEGSARSKDEERTKFLNAQGFEVLRFWNNEFFENTEGVLETICKTITTKQVRPLPNPPPAGAGIAEPDLRQWLDIVALGTVCDVVSLTGVNRAFVAQGLKVMAARENIGVRAVLDMAGIAEKPSVYHAGFVIGPRINAGGRVGKSDLGVRLLTCDDEQEAKNLAAELDKHNAERKAIESLVQEEAMQHAEAQADKPIILVQGKGWHAGVIGIVAGRIKERFNRPVAVIALADGFGKASARSVSGFDMGAAVIAARDAGLLVAGGGHAMAAGFTVEEQKLEGLRAFLLARAMTKHAELTRHKRLHLDAELTLAGVTEDLVEKIERLGPFGQGNPSVRVVVRGVVNMKPEIVGDSHIRTFLKDKLGKGSVSAIAFRAVDSKLGEALIATRGKLVDVACQMKINEWMGRRSVNLVIEDIASAGEAL